MAAAVAVVAVLLARGEPARRPAPPARPPAPAPPPVRPPAAPPPLGRGLALGLTEMQPALLWSRASGVDVGAFAPWRDRVSALRPRFLRVLVDWSQLQPDAARAPDLARSSDGCQRGLPPCRATGGLAEVLRAARSQQRAGGGFEVVLVLYGVPAWAAVPPSGCERAGLTARSRPITAAGLRAYRALVRALVALGRREDVPLRWWSAWNEPNGPFFLSPQRARCDAAAPSRAPRVYAALYRALRAELRAAGGDRRLVLGDLADVVTRRPLVTSARELVADLPEDVVCSADVVAQHAYAEVGRDPHATGVVGAVERVLDRRPCARRTPIWITEAGAGGTHAGERRRGGAAARRADCRALQDDLRRWWADPRVTAAFQYTVRDDPAFPVGLADARLRRAWPAFALLQAWAGDRAAAAPPPPGACAPGA